ncbi:MULTISPECIES: hypothetical protein [Pseudomonas]|uniref:Uncharacterized protein n=1 Tax=Pseudomonas fluorescens TaxID=294 RepID=A0A161ZA22_PSEFL|nr:MULTISPECIES: hypothetical protein [Pseudomonas]KZN20567.1 hypothetical protein A1D17_03230 [Pseudomonas fluorescens]
MIKLTCYNSNDKGEVEEVINAEFPVSVQGLLDAMRLADSIQRPDIRLSAMLALFSESVLVTDLVRDKSSVVEGWPTDPSEPAPMSMNERAAMFLRLAQIGELKFFIRKEYDFTKEQETAKGCLCYQGILGESMRVPPGFQGDPKFWYDFGSKQRADMAAEFESCKAA